MVLLDGEHLDTWNSVRYYRLRSDNIESVNRDQILHREDMLLRILFEPLAITSVCPRLIEILIPLGHRYVDTRGIPRSPVPFYLLN